MHVNSFSTKIVALSLIVAVLAIGALGYVAYSANAGPRLSQASSDPLTVTTTQSVSQSPSTISVSGFGTVNVQPDEVMVTFGVLNQGPNATLVLMKNSALMIAVIGAIEKLGINSSDVQTQQFNFGPTYAYNQNNGSQTVTGYSATNSVQVTLQGNGTSKLDGIINAAINAGANQIQGVSYTISSSLQSQLKQEALENAVADANATAGGVASSEHVKITGIQNVIVLSTSYPPYFYNNYQVYAATTTVVGGGANYSVPINPGQAQYSVDIQVTYLLG